MKDTWQTWSLLVFLALCLLGTLAYNAALLYIGLHFITKFW